MYLCSNNVLQVFSEDGNNSKSNIYIPTSIYLYVRVSNVCLVLLNILQDAIGY